MYESRFFVWGGGTYQVCLPSWIRVWILFEKICCILNVAGVFPIFLELPVGIIPLRHESNPPWAVPPRKLTWQWNIPHLKMYFQLQLGIFQLVMLVSRAVSRRKKNTPCGTVARLFLLPVLVSLRISPSKRRLGATMRKTRGWEFFVGRYLQEKNIQVGRF